MTHQLLRYACSQCHVCFSACHLYITDKFLIRCETCLPIPVNLNDENPKPRKLEQVFLKEYGGKTKEANLAFEKLDLFLNFVRSQSAK